MIIRCSFCNLCVPYFITTVIPRTFFCKTRRFLFMKLFFKVYLSLYLIFFIYFSPCHLHVQASTLPLTICIKCIICTNILCNSSWISSLVFSSIILVRLIILSKKVNSLFSKIIFWKKYSTIYIRKHSIFRGIMAITHNLSHNSRHT